MKSYISRKFPLDTRTTAQIFALRPGTSVAARGPVARAGFDVTGILLTKNLPNSEVVEGNRSAILLLPTLPDDLQSKLDLSRCRGGLVQSRRQGAAVRVKDGIVLPERIQKTWGQEVRVIQDVEKLASKLQIELCSAFAGASSTHG
jgi:hypothetical protein